MRKKNEQKKFSDSKILGILKEYETGVSAKDLSRKYGFHFQTLYDWKKRFGEISNVLELTKLRDLESENTKLKPMYANLSLEYEALKDVLSKKG